MALRRRGMLPTTLVVFLSDNGGPIQRESCNGGLRGGKLATIGGAVRKFHLTAKRGRRAYILHDVSGAGLETEVWSARRKLVCGQSIFSSHAAVSRYVT